MVIPEPTLRRNSWVPLIYVACSRRGSHGPERVTGEGVGVPEGGELGRRPSCLDVPMQEVGVGAQRGQCVCLNTHIDVCEARASAPVPIPPKDLNASFPPTLGLGFSICGTVGGSGAPGLGRHPGKEGRAVMGCHSCERGVSCQFTRVFAFLGRFS